jgi:tetratricopeptide (TPR) repeat protein
LTGTGFLEKESYSSFNNQSKALTLQMKNPILPGRPRHCPLAVLIGAGLICLLPVQVQSQSTTIGSVPAQTTALKFQLAHVKKQFIELAQRSALQTDLLLYRPGAAAVILSHPDPTPGILQSVSVRGPVSELVSHDYTPPELAALRRGGIHRLLDLDRLNSDLTLTAAMTILDRKEEARRFETTFSVKKSQVPAIIELTMRALPGQDPELKAQVLTNPDPARLEDIFIQNIQYLIDTKAYLEAAVLLSVILSQDKKGGDVQDQRKLLLGVTYLEWGVGEEAARLLMTLAEKPASGIRSAMAWFYLERLYYRQGAYEKALEAYLKAQRQLPQSLLPEAHYLAGNSLLYQKSYPKAVEYLSLVPEGSEWYPFALYSSGLAYLNARDVSSTLKQFQKLVKFSPGENRLFQDLVHRARITLGFYLVDQERYETALESFSEVPPSSLFADQALFGLGWTYLKMGECEKAVVAFEDLISKWPYSAFSQEARLKIGTCYSKLKAYRKAVQNYQEALRVYSDYYEKLGTLLDELAQKPLEEWLKTRGFPLGDSGSSKLRAFRTASTFPGEKTTQPCLSEEPGAFPVCASTSPDEKTTEPSLEATSLTPLILELTNRVAIQEAIIVFEDLERTAALINHRWKKTDDPSAFAPHKQRLEQLREQGKAVLKKVFSEQIQDLRQHMEERANLADIGLLKNFKLVEQ